MDLSIATNFLERHSRNQRKSKPQRRRARRENTEIWDTGKRGWIARAFAAPEGCPAARGAKARAIHSPTLRLQQNPRSSFFRVLISSVRSVKLRLGGEKNPFPAGKDLRVSNTNSVPAEVTSEFVKFVAAVFLFKLSASGRSMLLR